MCLLGARLFCSAMLLSPDWHGARSFERCTVSFPLLEVILKSIKSVKVIQCHEVINMY